MNRRAFITMIVGALSAPAFAAFAQEETFDDRWQRRVAVGGHLDIIPPQQASAVATQKPKPKRIRRRRYHRRKRR